MNFVDEMKSSVQKLKGSESMKIKCGKAHFEQFEDIVYKQVSAVNELSY